MSLFGKKKKKVANYNMDLRTPQQRSSSDEKYVERLERRVKYIGSLAEDTYQRKAAWEEQQARAAGEPVPRTGVEVKPLNVYRLPEGGVGEEPPAPADQPASEPQATAGDGFGQGAILCWDGPTFAIYKECVESKGYDLVYILSATGSLVPRGLALHAYLPEQIGLIPAKLFEEFERELTWRRDAVIFHLFDYRYCGSIPQIGQSPKQPAPAEAPAPAQDESTQAPAPEQASTPLTAESAPKPEPAPAPAQRPSLVRGAFFTLRMGKQQWDAVYWGKDVQGAIVAHNTNGSWDLMHLDLEKFRDSLTITGNLDPEAMREIEADLREKYPS
ncbi:hypothetical protein ACFL34_02500 [Candidatus Sumerlaeota bacterium]